MISSDDIKHLAELARINIAPAEEERVRADLEGILAYIAELSEIPASREVFPQSPAFFSRARDDRGGPAPLAGNEARDAFPRKTDGYCRVPSVFGNEAPRS